jgi:hypothetical protein
MFGKCKVQRKSSKRDLDGWYKLETLLGYPRGDGQMFKPESSQISRVSLFPHAGWHLLEEIDLEYKL